MNLCVFQSCPSSMFLWHTILTSITLLTALPWNYVYFLPSGHELLGLTHSQTLSKCFNQCSLTWTWILCDTMSVSLGFWTNLKIDNGGGVLRWQRNRMGRPLSPPQIHRKIIWMLSKYHKTTSECWQRTPGTQKGSPLSLKGGRTKYEK